MFKLETIILDELEKPLTDVTVEIVRSQNLIFHSNQPNSKVNAWVRAKVFARILKTRGLCRWLCFFFFSPISDRAYAITRNKLLFVIISNWHTFSKEVLAHLTISAESTEGFRRIALSEYSVPQGTKTFELQGNYLLEEEYYSTLDFSKGGIYWRNSTLARIIIWNSRYALNLIQQSSRLQNSDTLHSFIKYFPDFLERLESREALGVVFHPEYTKTLDQRFDDIGLENYDLINDIEIWHQRFIVKNKTWLLIDSTCSPELDFVAGHWQYLEQNKSKSDKVFMVKPKNVNKITLDKAIFLMGRVDENWYHLLLDTFPRYLQFHEIGSNVPVLVRADLPKSSLDFLKKVISHELLFVHPEDLISVNSLFFVAGRSTVYDAPSKNDDERVVFSPKSLAKVRDFILSRLALNHAIDLSSKIYLTRVSRYRNLVNQNAVASELQRSGYRVLEPSEEFFRNQFQVFAKGSHIVTPGGASLANIIFMNAGSKVTAIRSWRGSDLKLWMKLAESHQIEFDEIIGIPTYFGRNSLAREHSHFYLPIKWLRKFIES